MEGAKSSCAVIEFSRQSTVQGQLHEQQEWLRKCRTTVKRLKQLLIDYFRDEIDHFREIYESSVDNIPSNEQHTEKELWVFSCSTHWVKTREMSDGTRLKCMPAPHHTVGPRSSIAPGWHRVGNLTEPEVTPEEQSLHVLHRFWCLPQWFVHAGGILFETKYCTWWQKVWFSTIIPIYWHR